MPYNIEEHKHRFAAWASGRAASVKGCRFTVEQAKVIIEAVGLRRCIEDHGTLPAPAAVDAQHRLWRQIVIEEASRLGLTFTHGVAAKLINIYLKAALVCGGNHQHERIGCLHPPIDKVLLDELKHQNVGGLRKQWGAFSKAGWSNFDSDTYEAVIHSIRASIPHAPLWEIEGHWQGHQ